MKSYDVNPIPRCTPSRAENNIELFKSSSECRTKINAKRIKSYDAERSPGCTPLRTEINIESLKLSSVPRRQTNTNAKRNVTAVTPDGIVNLDHASKKKTQDIKPSYKVTKRNQGECLSKQNEKLCITTIKFRL